MRHILLIFVLAALVVAGTIPAMAQTGQESESGDVEVSFEVASEGDYASQCAAPLQFGQSGNLQRDAGLLQGFSVVDDVEFEGSSFLFEPAVEAACEQAVQQSAAASG